MTKSEVNKKMFFENLIGQFNNFVEIGGKYIYPLLFLNAILWYALGYRFHTLDRGGTLPVTEVFNRIKSGKIKKPRGIIGKASYRIIEKVKNSKIKTQDKIEELIDEVLLEYIREIKSYKTLVKALTVSAPLVGLLGTVDGMITMFTSLVDNAFYSSNGGIAGGVSKALYTTEIGLIIGAVGLIVGNYLNGKQKMLEEELLELKYYSLEKLKEEVTR